MTTRWLGATGVALALAILGAINLWFRANPLDVAAVAPVAGQGVGSDAAVDAQFTIAIPLANLAETLERPLFRPDRRKFIPSPEPTAMVPPAMIETPPPSPVEEPALPLISLVLVGTSAVASEAKALIRIEGQELAHWYARGDTVEGWRLAGVRNGTATLEREGATTELTLYPELGSGTSGGPDVQP